MAMKRHSGSQTIEFAMVIVPLMIVLLATFEFVRLMWVTMIFESAVNAAVREIRTLPPSTMLDNQIRDRIASFPLLDLEKIDIDPPRYSDSVQSLALGIKVTPLSAVMTEYQIRYRFSFLLVPALSEKFPSVASLSRTVLVSHDA
ncbi:TadE family protein [Vibrio neptunius]|uniref:TadE/TadG family type IV pilus assembly protein n=1 Tax=Vibrio neptunius TaxID=170651 RepID=UPI00331547D0